MSGLGDLVDGYYDGKKDSRNEFPETLSNRGEQYKHGWLNGRDDRLGIARATAETLRERADDAIKKDSWPM